MMLRKKDFMYKNLTWVLVENSNSKVLSNIDKFAIIFIFYMRTLSKIIRINFDFHICNFVV